MRQLPRIAWSDIAKFWQNTNPWATSTMNICLPDTLKAFVDEQVAQRSYGTSSEYVRELIRRDQDRLQLRSLLLACATSAPACPADSNYFDVLRAPRCRSLPGIAANESAPPAPAASVAGGRPRRF